ncbi:MAG: alkaline phosphatase family protein, partial [Candidatus Eremiobacteraeota bacterium]|nr:alkaline phosphatase family protein [Candidatus Eremiobacteraeota bacterium]
MIRRYVVIAIVILLLIAAFAYAHFRSGNTRLTEIPPFAPPAITHAAALPHAPAHTIVIIDENKSFEEIIGNTKDAPYLNQIAPKGALFTQSYGVAHPSQPNYFALFSGLTNANGDSCAVAGVPPDAPNLATALLGAKRSFAGYAEGLPSVGFAGCTAGNYARKHAPWTHFSNVPAALSRPYSTFKYASIPTLSFIIPNIMDDMHTGTLASGDAWMRRNLT